MEARVGTQPSATEWAAAVASQLLTRHGIVTREAVAVENLPGGFSAVYDVLKAMEEAGRIRRGYFVGGLGATQFALPAAVDLLALGARRAGDAADRLPGGDGSGQSVRGDSQMAGRGGAKRRADVHVGRRGCRADFQVAET